MVGWRKRKGHDKDGGVKTEKFHGGEILKCERILVITVGVKHKKMVNIDGMDPKNFVNASIL